MQCSVVPGTSKLAAQKQPLDSAADADADAEATHAAAAEAAEIRRTQARAQERAGRTVSDVGDVLECQQLPRKHTPSPCPQLTPFTEGRTAGGSSGVGPSTGKGSALLPVSRARQQWTPPPQPPATEPPAPQPPAPQPPATVPPQTVPPQTVPPRTVPPTSAPPKRTLADILTRASLRGDWPEARPLSPSRLVAMALANKARQAASAVGGVSPILLQSDSDSDPE